MKSDPITECAVCAKPFMRRNTMQVVCGIRCAQRVPVIARKAKAAEFRRRKEAAKTRQELMAEATAAFHAYIRARDAGKPCICCGKPMEPDKPGGAVDAGHYMSRGNSPELRFDEVNTNAQRKNCNRPGGTTRGSFRAWMIERWGLAEVERLEGPNPARKWTADDLRAIRDEYRAKLKAIE